jgi:hypothetical protein
MGEDVGVLKFFEFMGDFWLRHPSPRLPDQPHSLGEVPLHVPYQFVRVDVNENSGNDELESVPHLPEE